MTIREATLWASESHAASHALHHAHTIMVGRDPEIQACTPPQLGTILPDFFCLFCLISSGRLRSNQGNFIAEA